MRCYLLLILAMASCPTSLYAQPQLLGHQPGMIPGGNGDPVIVNVPITSTSSLFNLLNSEVGQEFLGLNEKQKIAISEITSKAFSDMSEDAAVLSEVMNLRAASSLATEALMQDLEFALPAVLNEKQTEQLYSIRLPDLVQRDGLVGAMKDPLLGKKLDLTPEELRLLNMKAKQIESEIEEKLQELRREAIAELVESVPRAKRKEVESFLQKGMEKQISVGLSFKGK